MEGSGTLMASAVNMSNICHSVLMGAGAYRGIGVLGGLRPLKQLDGLGQIQVG